MKKYFWIYCIITVFHLQAYCQEKTLKTNPIIFAEAFIGYSGGSSRGFTFAAELNYQSKQNLFTYRYLELIKNRREGNILFIPIYIEVEKVKEQALLYGKRIVEGNLSYSYSAGIAYVDREFLIDSSNGVLKYDNTQSIGFPFELNIKWFNSSKQKYRIYELFPVGKPTGFANSIGFKLYGDISKTTFVGLGVTFGFGWHRQY